VEESLGEVAKSSSEVEAGSLASAAASVNHSLVAALFQPRLKPRIKLRSSVGHVPTAQFLSRFHSLETFGGMELLFTQ
jgi:hypothetical protein